MSLVEYLICFKGCVGCLRGEMNLFRVRAERVVCKTGRVAGLCTSRCRTCRFESLTPCVLKTISTLFGFPLHVTGYMKLTHLRAINTPGTDIKTIKYTLFQSSKRMTEGVESIKLARSRLMSRGCKTEQKRPT